VASQEILEGVEDEVEVALDVAEVVEELGDAAEGVDLAGRGPLDEGFAVVGVAGDGEDPLAGDLGAGG
jgi:hypothetical protein